MTEKKNSTQIFTIATIGAIAVFLLGLFVGTKIPRPITSGPTIPDNTAGPSDTPYDLDTGKPKPETTYFFLGDSTPVAAPPETLYNWWRGGIITEVKKTRFKLKVSILMRDGWYYKDFNLVGDDFVFYWDDAHNDWVQKSSTRTPDPPKRFKIRGMIVGTTVPSVSADVDFVYKNTWLIGAGAVWRRDYNDKYIRAGVQFELNF